MGTVVNRLIELWAGLMFFTSMTGPILLLSERCSGKMGTVVTPVTDSFGVPINGSSYMRDACFDPVTGEELLMNSEHPTFRIGLLLIACSLIGWPCLFACGNRYYNPPVPVPELHPVSGGTLWRKNHQYTEV